MQVRVWNTNRYPFKQKWKDSIITIPAGKYIEMERSEAVEFKSSFYPVELDYNGDPKPQSYNRIEIRPIPQQGQPDLDAEPKFVNHATGEEFDSHEELMASIKQDPSLVASQRSANEDLEVAKDAKTTRRAKS
jgi:hypothetical protein